jgi:farnesyl diphosphate synthase
MLQQAMKDAARAVDGEIGDLLGEAEGPEARLFEAMRYSALGGGKRFRPFLAIHSAYLFNVPERSALKVAAAVELVHCYSLVHDDLPAMDDDGLRRGQPTTHVKYDEATAILVGDALLTLAFEALASMETHSDPAVICELVRALAQAAGGHGMVGGQMIDIAAENQEFDIGAITRLQRLKTGALIAFACESGAILGKAPSSLRHALRAYAHDLGLAFQIADDLLDTEGDEQLTGKRVGKDATAGKATFVSILGAKRAREQARMLADQAAQHLDPFAEKADILRQAASFVVERRS